MSDILLTDVKLFYLRNETGEMSCFKLDNLYILFNFIY